MRRIDSPANATLKAVRALAHDARARNEAGLTVIEGEHLCRAWLDRGWTPERVLVDEAALGRADIAACVARLETARVEVIAMPSALIKAAGSTDSPVPLLGVVKPLPGDAVACRGADCLLLDGVQDPGNVGTMLRTAAAAGVRHAICGPGCAALWSPKVLRAAMGAHVALNLIETADLPGLARSLAVDLIGAEVSATAFVHRIDLRAPMAWVFGAEGAGLSAAMQAVLTRRVAIAQTDAVESLNVAAAAAVCLFEMRRQRLG